MNPFGYRGGSFLTTYDGSFRNAHRLPIHTPRWYCRDLGVRFFLNPRRPAVRKETPP